MMSKGQKATRQQEIKDLLNAVHATLLAPSIDSCKIKNKKKNRRKWDRIVFLLNYVV
jgi:Spy/CpxP family protein refolding chaperone